MKKYLLAVISSAFLMPDVTAMEGGGDSQKTGPLNPPSSISTTNSLSLLDISALDVGIEPPSGSEKPRLEQPSASLPTVVLPPTVDPTQVKKEFKENPRNYEKKGGFLGGFFSEPALKEESVEALIDSCLEQNKVLRDQVVLATRSLESMGALQRALQEAQQNLDREVSAKRELEERLRATEARAKFLKADQESLLLEGSKKDAASLLDQARKRFLEAENLQLRQIIADLAGNASELEALLAANRDYERTLLVLTGTAEEIEQTRLSIHKVMDQNKVKITDLQEKYKALAQLERETKEKIQKLEQAIEANDYYTQIAKKIKDSRVSDEDLALFIWSVKTVQGVDLDELSVGHDDRLIEMLINVSKPYQPRPFGTVTCTYEGRIRMLGNDFVPGGLVWNGVPFQIKDCKYSGSKFEQRTQELARTARQKFSQHK